MLQGGDGKGALIWRLGGMHGNLVLIGSGL
jgi:hypothetical protein